MARPDFAFGGGVGQSSAETLARDRAVEVLGSGEGEDLFLGEAGRRFPDGLVRRGGVEVLCVDKILRVSYGFASSRGGGHERDACASCCSGSACSHEWRVSTRSIGSDRVGGHRRTSQSPVSLIFASSPRRWS